MDKANKTKLVPPKPAKVEFYERFNKPKKAVEK